MDENVGVSITVNLPEIFITQIAFDKIKNESALAVKQYGKMIEFAGILYGRFSGHNIYINDIERLPEEIAVPTRSFRQKVMMIPTGGEIATSAVNEYVSQRNDVVGFYHTHPFISATLTGGDKEQLRKLKLFPHLKKLGTIHVISRLKGLGFSATPENPVFYAHVEGMGYIEVKPKIIATLPKEIESKNPLYSEDIEGNEFAGMNPEDIPKFTGEYGFEGKYIKHNVLLGPFSDLDKMLRDETYQKHFLDILDKALKSNPEKHWYETDPNTPPIAFGYNKAIDAFSDYLINELFGEIAGKKFLEELRAISVDIVGGGAPGIEQILRGLLKEIIKNNLTYNPRTGENNLKDLSLEMTETIDSFFQNDRYIQGRIRRLSVRPDDFNNLFVRYLILFAIRAVFEGIAFQWIRYGNYVKDESIKIFNEYTESRNQFQALIGIKMVGLILFRGLKFFSSQPAIKYSINPKPGYFAKYILDLVLSNFPSGYYGSTSWSKDWEVSAGFAHKFYDYQEIPPKTYEEFLNDLNRVVPESPIRLFVFRVDKKDDIINILKTLSEIDYAFLFNTGVMLSHPLMADYNDKAYREPIQFLFDVDPFAVFEAEVALSPRNFKITDNSIDMIFDMLVLNKNTNLWERLSYLLQAIREDRPETKEYDLLIPARRLLYYELSKYFISGVKIDTSLEKEPRFIQNLLVSESKANPIFFQMLITDLQTHIRIKSQIEIILDCMQRFDIISGEERQEYFGQ